MIERLAIDANAAIDVMRPRRPDPPPLIGSKTIFLPLPVLGELLAGAKVSMDAQRNLKRVASLRRQCELLLPDENTANIYGDIRAMSGNVQPLGKSKLNDLWIAALCLQHNLPLLTNDRGFDNVAGLKVIHW
ncbi:MAG TPA: PIN domain-containing protein [Thermoanaerobaculia bacterium]|nr:PIN domain-containing protein [Thermoanaerobaculia bacterium]